VLDACIAQLDRGHDLEAVLAAYPDQADVLRPMLVAAALMRLDAPPPVHKSAHKAQFLAAVHERRRQVETANGIVVEVKAGVPVREMLARSAPDLRPLVVAAWRMYTTPAPSPAPGTVAAGRERIMAMAARRQAARRRAARRSLLPQLPLRAARALVGLRRGLAPSPSLGRRAWSGSVAAILSVALVGMTAAGLGTAAASSLPGESFYSVKELGRSAQMLFAFDPARRAELHLRFAEQRLREMEALAASGRPIPRHAVEQWLSGQASALEDIRALPRQERELLADRLLTAVDRGRSAQSSLGTVLDDAALDRLLRSSHALVDRGTAEPPAARAAERSDARELPAEKTGPRPRAAEADGRAPMRAEVAAPAAESAPQSPPAGPADPQVAQPGHDQDEARPASGGRAPAASTRPAPGAPAAPEPVVTPTDAPPAFNQPVFEEPTDTPGPLPGPGSSQGDPPDLPVEPVTPLP